MPAENSKLRELYRGESAPQSRLSGPIVLQNDLLGFLNMTGLDDTDLEYILGLRVPLTSKGRDPTNEIMKSPKFKEWLVTSLPQELLIHGNSDSQPISPLSFFCAMLVRNLRSVNTFRPITFFCGRHIHQDYGGGRTMIICLLTQLLQQQHFDLGFIRSEDAYQMNHGNIEAFCYIFGSLVQQVKTTESVFCVIDGINFYERSEDLLQEMAYVLRFLLDLTKGRTVFKILITSPSTTEDVRQAIKDDNYLALPEPARNTQPFSNLRFERQVNEELEMQDLP